MDKDPYFQLLTKIAEVEMDMDIAQSMIDEARHVPTTYDLPYQMMLDEKQTELNVKRALINRKKKEIYGLIGAL